ncbi:MAG: alpha/beta hydrolase [Candidatus Sabulitectum sp.]|nr:alpha/beta hydrolase [Candidatus Sabulitectum sp.]
MEIVFISGWATTSAIWKNIGDTGFPVHYLEWNEVLAGSVTLPSSCIVVGWSLGGQLALDMLNFPEVKGLLLISSMSCIASASGRPGVDPSSFHEISSMLSRSRAGYLKSFFRKCGAGRDELPELMKQSSSFTDEELLLGLEMMFKKVVKPARSLPATLIHGTSDAIIPFECSMHIFEEMLFMCTSLVPVSGGNHLLPLTHPDVVTEAIKELAERIDS